MSSPQGAAVLPMRRDPTRKYPFAVPTTMPPKRRGKVTASSGAKSQTSGIFKLPIELLLEIFSYLSNHRRFIKGIGYHGPAYSGSTSMGKEEVEQSTAIRRLTMTCRALQTALLPILWKDVEGCEIWVPDSRGKSTYGLYAQCKYLLSHPTIATHVQVFSVDLQFKSAPEDLMKVFVDTLIQLPNLKRLELLSVSHRTHAAAVLRRKYATFPNIREVLIEPTYPDIIKNCPNLESLTFLQFYPDIYIRRMIESYGSRLKRVTEIGYHPFYDLSFVVNNLPNLEEIGIIVPFPSYRRGFDQLRQLEHLAVIVVDFIERDRTGLAHEQNTRHKSNLIEILRNSPSESRKFLRWKKVVSDQGTGRYRNDYQVVESGELEVLPETSL